MNWVSVDSHIIYHWITACHAVHAVGVFLSSKLYAQQNYNIILWTTLLTLVVLDRTSGLTTQPGYGIHLCNSGVNTSCMSTSVANRHVAASLQVLYTVGCTTSCALYANSLLVSYSLVTQQWQRFIDMIWCVAVMYVLCSATEPSLVPRPSAPPVFDRFQYAYWKRSKAGGAEGLGMRQQNHLYSYYPQSELHVYHAKWVECYITLWSWSVTSHNCKVHVLNMCFTTCQQPTIIWLGAPASNT